MTTLATRIVCAFLLFSAFLFPASLPAASLAPSNRVVVNLGETPWKYLRDQNPAGAQAPAFDDSAWTTVGVPYSASQLTMFINQESGGGEGQLGGGVNWYRKHFTLDSAYANRKVFVEFEGAHMGIQVYINGTFLPGNSPLNPQATHVVGFLPVIVDLTPYLHFGGADNVLAVRVAKNADWFQNPGFSGAFRFGQGDTGLFRPVYMYITDKVHIPRNTYAGLGTWGTYVSTLAASDESATIDVQTNVLNEGSTNTSATLTVQIVDADGNVVAARQSTRTIPASADRQPVLFDMTLSVDHPTLWYPNNSVYGTPYLYKVFHTVSIDGAVIDAVETPLGIRTITWDADLPYFNGHPQYLWGGSGRYDYPALGTTVPEEQQWRDLEQLAAAGGNLYRPGHSSSSREFVAAADALGVMIVQPSGDGENGFAAHCDDPPCYRQEIKAELHREMIVRDRNHPSILAWEADNGVTDTEFAQRLKALSLVWDPIQQRAQADRTPDSRNGDILGCTLEGCEVGVKQSFPDNPAWGSEYWGTGGLRYDYDHEIQMLAPFLNDWRKSVEGNAFGMVQWYFADTVGESGTLVDGTPNALVRGLNDSMVDINRFPRLLYYAYKAAWRPYELEPVVALAHHWNRSGTVRVNAFSNCPKVRLLVNGAIQGSDQTPNPWNSDPHGDLSQTTTALPFQVHWDVTWQAGTLTAQCLDALGHVVASDEKRTAGAAARVALDVVPNVVRPDGRAFQVTANGSDAAFVTACIVDANGVTVPTAANLITFAVSGPATYMGGSQSLVTPDQPITYHSPGDPELAAEGGLQRIALRSQFTPGTVTVTATSPGLANGSTTLTIHPVPDTTPVATTPSIIAQPEPAAVTAGQPGHFSVTASGAAPLAFQWRRNGAAIGGATSSTYDTPATTLADNGASFSVLVSNALGSTVSDAATLTVEAPAAPAIVTPPQSVIAAVGQTATFSVVASGSPVLSYQWLRDDVPIAGAVEASYTTPVLALEDNGAAFRVVVTNPVDSIVSPTATLTVNPAVAPVIVSAPSDVVALPGQPASFHVEAEGSDPLHYQWRRDGNITGADSATLSIAAAGPGSIGSYTVTVSNVAGSVTSAPATLSLAPPGFNLALGKTATASSYENAGTMPAGAAIDGDLDTRWSSAHVDPSWITVDLGASMNFNRIILRWQNAYGSSYRIDVSDDDQEYRTVYSQESGHGGNEDFSFPTTRARYVRMFGRARGTDFGYSLFEFEIYNAAACGESTDRYSVIDTDHVRDNASGLVWSRTEYTYTDPGAQLTQPLAAAYCSNLDMRLPTLDEALAISGADSASCAFPSPWNTWTSTFGPDPTYAWWVSSTGNSNLGVADNLPGWALCTQGPTAQAPIITTQPADVTTPIGTAVVLGVEASGVAPLSYEWQRNGETVAVTGVPSYQTPVLTAADDGVQYSVVVRAANALATTSESATVTVVDAPIPVPTITAQPQPQTAAVGSRATFTVGADGLLPLTWQWRRNNAAIAGATAATYTTPTLTIGDNTAVYSVIVGNGGGSVTSAGARLSVVMPGRPNLALEQAVTSSSDQNAGLAAVYAVDGDGLSRWASLPVDDSWICVDLGDVLDVGEVVLHWENAYGSQYTIEVSPSGDDWTTVYTQADGHGGVEDLHFATTPARYVRMHGSTRATNFGYSLYEFEIYGPPGDAIFANGFDGGE